MFYNRLGACPFKIHYSTALDRAAALFLWYPSIDTFFELAKICFLHSFNKSVCNSKLFSLRNFSLNLQKLKFTKEKGLSFPSLKLRSFNNEWFLNDKSPKFLDWTSKILYFFSLYKNYLSLIFWHFFSLFLQIQTCIYQKYQVDRYLNSTGNFFFEMRASFENVSLLEHFSWKFIF